MPVIACIQQLLYKCRNGDSKKVTEEKQTTILYSTTKRYYEVQHKSGSSLHSCSWWSTPNIHQKLFICPILTCPVHFGHLHLINLHDLHGYTKSYALATIPSQPTYVQVVYWTRSFLMLVLHAVKAPGRVCLIDRPIMQDTTVTYIYTEAKVL